MNAKTEFQRLTWGDQHYERAFNTLLECSGERPHVHAYLRNVLKDYGRDSRAVDWGAGSGDLTTLLLEQFEHVTAIEPSAVFRSYLEQQCPTASIVNGTLTDHPPLGLVDVGLISHVLYHIPDHKWPACALRAAHQLSRQGVLLMMLKDADSGCNRMLEYFGAPRFNLVERIQPLMAMNRDFNYTVDRVAGSFKTSNLNDTLDIARLMLCDRDEDAFSSVPSEQDFADYVREHFWNDVTGEGGWDYDVMIVAMRRRRA